jgi:hypothetical protein
VISTRAPMVRLPFERGYIGGHQILADEFLCASPRPAGGINAIEWGALSIGPIRTRCFQSYVLTSGPGHRKQTAAWRIKRPHAQYRMPSSLPRTSKRLCHSKRHRRARLHLSVHQRRSELLRAGSFWLAVFHQRSRSPAMSALNESVSLSASSTKAVGLTARATHV